MYLSAFFIVLAAYPACVLSKYLEREFIVQPGYDAIHDDIRLTPEQKLMKMERGFYTAGKWPLVNNVVTVPYFFSTESIPQGDALRNIFKKAVSVYEANTCIRWVETTAQDKRNKVEIFKGQGCFSNVGMVEYGDVSLSLGMGCDNVPTMIHEMGHTMGLFHTQSRPDRDDHVKVWLKNVQPGMEHNFDISTGEFFKVPYDYKSMMHYGNDYFSTNGSFTLTTIDPLAMFSIGRRPSTFRWSDAAMLNQAYTCDKIFAAACPGKSCANDGYVGKDCKCQCPENTSGDRCETVTGSFFSDVPTCGGTITSEGEIKSNGYGTGSTTDKCIFNIVAPECKRPSITITAGKFLHSECYANKLAIQISKDYFGPVFCKSENLPIGKTFVSDSKQAAVYFFVSAMGFPDVGFKANVNFVTDPNCGKPVITTTTTMGPIVTTVIPPKGPCVLTNLGVNSFKYSTPGYPKTVDPKIECQLIKNPSQNTDLIFTKAQVTYNLGKEDVISFQEKRANLMYIGISATGVFYTMWPISVRFISAASPGQGFSVTYTPVTGLPRPCNGEILKMNKGTSRVFTNPLVGFSEKKASCAFKIETSDDAKLIVQGITLGLTPWESLSVTPRLPKLSHMVLVTSNPITTQNNVAIVYYTGGDVYTNWQFKVTAS